MAQQPRRAIAYTRDIDDPNPVKFEALDRLIRQVDHREVDTVVVAHPKVLGDTY